MSKHTVNFVRVARKGIDSTDSGFIYMHVWPTGWQELFFHTKDDAVAFETALNK